MNNENKQKITKHSHTQTSLRLWVFRLIAITLIPLLMFFLLELILWVIDYGFPTNTIIRYQVNQKNAYCDNFMFSWQFFPREISRESLPFTFLAEKPKDTYRIFVFGSSAAQGVPAGEYSFGRILKVMLQQKYPKINFEVITLAMPAINSHVVLKIVKDCINRQGDLFVVYLGNNEVVGPYGAGTVFAPLNPNLSLIRAGIAFRATRIGQLMKNLIESIHSLKNSPETWQGMEMFLGKQVRSDSNQLQTVYRHFQKNIDDIIRISVNKKIPIIFSTVGVNLKDSPPFASLHQLGLKTMEKETWDKDYQKGADFEADGKYPEAVNSYLAAAEIDDAYADLQFRLGRCYWEMAEYDKARERYIKAKEFDALRFRADDRINTIIYEAAADRQKEGVYFVDAVKTFETNSPHDIPGQELFYEHVHLNFAGNYLLAKTYFDKIELILPEKIRSVENKTVSLLTEAECKQLLAYTIWDEYNLTFKIINSFIKEPPHTNQIYHEEHVRQMEHKLENLKAVLTKQPPKAVEEQYLEAIQRNPEDWWLHLKYAKFLTTVLKNPLMAAEQYRKVIEILPCSYNIHTDLASVVLSQGNFDAAIESSIKAIHLNPFCADAYHNLGIAYAQKGQVDKAIKQFSRAIQISPYNPEGFNKMAILLDMQGKAVKAEKVYRKGLKFSPDDLVLRYNLADFLVEQKRYDEAKEEINIALKLKPDTAEFLELLNKLKKNNK